MIKDEILEKLKLSGQKFGRLTVLYENPVRTKRGNLRWDCHCECGNKTTVAGSDLRKGSTTSCGCYKEEFLFTHRKTGSKVYKAWGSIKARCCDVNSKDYDRYGGAGISIHPDFVVSFEAFYAEVGDPPEESYKWSVDRIDNQKGYEPGNMRWATAAQQSRNQSMRSDNKSGFVGVYYKEMDGSGYWFAIWSDLQNKRKTKSFSVNKHGATGAKQKAIEARAKAITELNNQGAGYSATHGQ